MIGHATSANIKTACVSATTIGIGGTSRWTIGTMTPQSSFAIYFEPSPSGLGQPTERGMIQFTTYYQHISGQYRLRVTTVARDLSDSSSPSLVSGFDLETAAVAMIRIAVLKAERDDVRRVLYWLDKTLIDLCREFAVSRPLKGPARFRLPERLLLYPCFLFHLRRSSLLMTFNTSPDETTFYRWVYLGSSYVLKLACSYIHLITGMP